MRPTTVRQTRSATVLTMCLLAVALAGSLLTGCSQQDTILGPEKVEAVSQRFFGMTASQGPTTVSKDIGSAGGNIVAGPATLHVPAGALSETVTITVTGIEGYAPSCELLPHGQTFNENVTLVLERNNPEHNTILWFDEAASEWVDVGGEVVGNSIQTELEHFSQYVVGIVE